MGTLALAKSFYALVTCKLFNLVGYTGLVDLILELLAIGLLPISRALYVSSEIDSQVVELELLVSFAIMQPHATFLAFLRNVISKWLLLLEPFLMLDIFQALGDDVRHCFIPSVTGRSVPGDLQRIICPSSQIGGFGIVNSTYFFCTECSASNKITQSLQSLILSQTGVYTDNARNVQLAEIQHSKSSRALSAKVNLLERAPASLGDLLKQPLRRGIKLSS